MGHWVGVLGDTIIINHYTVPTGLTPVRSAHSFVIRASSFSIRLHSRNTGAARGHSPRYSATTDANAVQS